jgi:hypothetical protein
MQALIISSLLGLGQGLLVKLLSKEALKVLFVKVTEMIVKSTKTEHDDQIWNDLKPILTKFDEK